MRKKMDRLDCYSTLKILKYDALLYLAYHMH